MRASLRLQLLEVPPSRWWVVRGESGALWERLFLAKGVVAQGTRIDRFDLRLPPQERDKAMAKLDAYDKREVHSFLDHLDDAGIVMPDAGSRQVGLGVVTGSAFAAEEEHWQQRTCTWHPTLLEAPPTLYMHLRTLGVRGTIFQLPDTMGEVVRELASTHVK